MQNTTKTIKGWSAAGQVGRQIQLRRDGDNFLICVTPEYYTEFDRYKAVKVSVAELLRKIADALDKVG